MKKTLISMLIIFCPFIVFADNNTDKQQTGNTRNVQYQKKLFLQTGAIESFTGNKYILRKMSGKIEFFINEATVILMRMPGTFSDVKEKKYLVVKGPHNKNTILANSIYVYENKNEYGLFSEERKTADVPIRYSFLLAGYVRQTTPFLTISVDGKDYIVSFDEDTKFIINKTATKDDIKTGDAVTLFFDKLISIRYDNYPIKIIIKKSGILE